MDMTALGVVLAGGRSRRLEGQDKALLDLGEGPLLARALEILRSLCAGVLVVGDPARHAGYGAPVIPDRMSGCGPLGGLDAALAAAADLGSSAAGGAGDAAGAATAGAAGDETGDPAPASFVLLLGCDLPFVRSALLDALLEAPARRDVVLPTVAGRDEPLCARYATRIQPRVAAALERRQLQMIRLYRDPDLDVERLAVERMTAVTAEDLFNLNTPEDLETARRIAARRRQERVA
jgi:molybdopterin-guanine dinucleotide biosynthesis protein A